MNSLRVLVACESSGRVRDAFIRLGHNAVSCDILPSEQPGPHIQRDIIQVLDESADDAWDLLIAFPPCTHLASSGARWFETKQVEQRKAIWFFLRLTQTKVPAWGVENPIGIMSRLYRKPDQIIQPWQFGHNASKSTCLWLNNLPKLVPTDFIEPRIVNGKRRWANQTDSGQNKLGPSPSRATDRGRTYEGIARAMAEQWGKVTQ